MSGQRFRLGYRPELDGLRAFAIVPVMILHLGVILPGGFQLATGGQAGVTLFFVLSGFLITTLLLQEWQGSGRIDLRAFYLRRALRLFPALFVLLACYGLLSVALQLSDPVANAGEVETIRRAIPPALFYVANWVYAIELFPLGGLSITWSLSVEEQFYLLWPLALIAMLRFGVSRRNTLLTILAGIGALTLWRVVLMAAGASANRINFGSDTRADALLVGCALGVIAVSGWLPSSDDARRWLMRAFWVSLIVFALCVLLAPIPVHGIGYGYLPVYTLTALAGAGLIAGLLTTPLSFARPVLASAPLVWIGQRSYGLYLWHQVIFRYVAPHVPALPLPYAHQTALLLLTLVPVALSFTLIERPFLRLKGRARPEQVVPVKGGDSLTAKSS